MYAVRMLTFFPGGSPSFGAVYRSASEPTPSTSCGGAAASMWASTSDAWVTAGEPRNALTERLPSEKRKARAFCSQTRY